MRLISLFAFLFLLVACNEEKEFMTPKQGEVVLDVGVDVYSLNGKVLGKTATDFSDDDVLVDSFNIELKKMRENLGDEVLQMLTTENDPVKRTQIRNDYPLVKIHYDSNVPYDVFYKSYMTVLFNFDSYQLAFGSNYKEICWLHEPHERTCLLYSFWCEQLNNAKLSDVLFGTNRFPKTLANLDIGGDDLQLCAALLSLALGKKDGNLVYVVSSNETGRTDGFRIDVFKEEKCLWEFIEKKTSYSHLTLRVQDDILVKDFAPVIKKLNSYGYQIKFAALGK